MALTTGQLARRLGFELHGDADVMLKRINDLRKAGEGDLSFLTSAEFLPYLRDTGASAVIVREAQRAEVPPGAVALVTRDPYLGYARAAQLLHLRRRPAPGVHPSAVVDAQAVIDPSAHVAANCVIAAGAHIGVDVVVQAGCVVAEDVVIGAGSLLEPNVTVLEGVMIGERCLIHSGAVIGADGFGFANDGGEWVKIPQIGGVVIGNNVEIGANTTIDRGAVEDTVVSDGVKLDNLIQVAHNVRIGRNTAIAGCTGIAGSTTIGERCAIGGGVGITGHIEIADGVTITARSFVPQSVPEAGSYSAGTPLQPTAKWRRNFLRMRQLDAFAKRLKKLETKLAHSDDEKC